MMKIENALTMCSDHFQSFDIQRYIENHSIHVYVAGVNASIAM